MLFTCWQKSHDGAGFRGFLLRGALVRVRFLFCLFILMAGLLSAPAILRAMEEHKSAAAHETAPLQTAEKPQRPKPVYHYNGDGLRASPQIKSRPAEKTEEVAVAEDPALLDAEKTCLDENAVYAAEASVQSAMTIPRDASGPFGPAHMTRKAFPDAPYDDGAAKPHPKAYVAIVIDDVGVDYKRSARAINLPAEVTLAFLPYAKHVTEQVRKAEAKGHELMVHLPMEPLRMSVNPGENYLAIAHSHEELQTRIARNLDTFGGYKGVNNHMGSAFTRYVPGVEVLMDALKERGVYFLDSKTAPDSVAEKIARRKGVPATHRDVFLDHFETSDKVNAALAQLERTARSSGYAVAIGHPKDVTMTALEAWLPTLADKNIEVIPMSEMVKKRHAAQKAHSAGVTAKAPAE